MGFFNKILKGLGFESEESDPPKKEPAKVKEKKEKNKPIFASYDLEKDEDILKPKLEEEEKEEVTPIANQEVKSEDKSNGSVDIIKVKNQVEVQKIVDRIKNGEKILINMSEISGQDVVRSLDFLTGAIYALGKTIQKVDSTIYLIQ